MKHLRTIKRRPAKSASHRLAFLRQRILQRKLYGLYQNVSGMGFVSTNMIRRTFGLPIIEGRIDE